MLNGVEQVVGGSATVWGPIVLKAPLKSPGSAYSPSDMSAGGLDGDGQWEFIVKWNGAANDNSQSGVTDNVYLDAYKMNGRNLSVLQSSSGKWKAS